ncbi:hypothetical protein MEN41_06900 [Dolichospermum sp. ST_con]|nr:hypothetical protein [Dolichospermum sp. ST_con]MDD1419759.1 hypothetical protein [Dolichospermum sp. ST_sed1]MDD1423634.1 hypothetical protein [Dolichospermum sp. ST_sed9]MDD1429574.1 hypothetical protein [Dolichospermum sp. ST_sed6]MDD1436580.1 hypothetical protein [Dolichospermum sp. ST_sed10]MDD1438856.1 hypothetical protein [Dolichospermum sp. ST_sed3]MDD1447744.1 hypothetical protein [Dolichospermum sp. ST_sed8]MDD1456115.1 hypothetical protein [Dolichospermum sp. ST_sed7]MDD145868
MKTTTGSNYSQPPTNYPPSVPLCVYRELTAELQAVQSKLDVITNHNQKLVQENQQLRQEITKVIQSCLELQKFVNTPSPSSPAPSPPDNEVNYQSQPQPVPRNNNEVRYTNKPNVKTAPPRQQAAVSRTKAVTKATPPQKRRQESAAHIKDINSPVSETVFIEEEKVRYSPNPHSQTKGLNGWWLVITIILIMVTGFAAGYLIVRPLFQNQTQPETIKN